MNQMITSTAALQPIGTGLFMRFVEYIDRAPKTTRTYTVNLRQFIAWMKYAGIAQPTRQDVIAYRDWLMTEHDAIELDAGSLSGWKYRTDSNGNRQRIVCKPNTVKQYLQSVKQFFTWTAAEGLYTNVAANVHAPKITASHRKDALNIQDVQVIEQSITDRAAQAEATAAEAAKDVAGRMQRSTEQGKRLFAIYLLAVNAGLRTVEISRANIRDLELKGGSAYLYIWGKGHTEPDTKKPLAPAVYSAIIDYLDSRTDSKTGTSALFVATGNRSGGKRLAPTTISTMLKKAMQNAGYDSDRVTAHSLRHTVGKAVMDITGDNIYKTQQYMRHSNPATTEIYLDNNNTETNEILAQRVYDHYHGQQTDSTAAERLQAVAKTMSPAQLEQLAAIAAAMTNRF